MINMVTVLLLLAIGSVSAANAESGNDAEKLLLDKLTQGQIELRTAHSGVATQTNSNTADINALKEKVTALQAAPAPAPTPTSTPQVPAADNSDPLKDWATLNGVQRQGIIMTQCNGKTKWAQDTDATAMQKVIAKYSVDQARKIVETCDLKAWESDSRALVASESPEPPANSVVPDSKLSSNLPKDCAAGLKRTSLGCLNVNW